MIQEWKSNIIPADSFASAELQVLPPHPGLARWIQCIWIINSSNLTPSINEKLYPDAGSSLTFKISNSEIETLFFQNTITTRYLWCLTSLHISVRFKPGAAWALLDLPVSELKDQPVNALSLNFTMDNAFKQLTETLQKGSSFF